MTELAAIGIDSGSTTCKIVGVDKEGEMTSWKLEASDPRIEDQVARLIEEMKGERSVPVISTGYGRKLVKSADREITEITCHARGVFRELGQPGTLVDIGGQDSKVIVISDQGRVIDFVMNDKCAAGTGRFLENTAARLGVDIASLGDRALAATGETAISSTCTVFAESEIISLLAHGETVEDILIGLHRSLTSRVVSMVKSVGFRPPLMLSGGVAQNKALRQVISEALDCKVVLPKHPQLMGAYGAALIGLES